MNKNVYNIVGKFHCCENTMLVVRMSGATCVMSEEEYNRIIITERKYNQHLRKKVA